MSPTAYECACSTMSVACDASRGDPGAPLGRWLCTRVKGHAGPHVAMNYEHEIKAVWKVTRKPARRSPSQPQPRRK